MLGHMYSNINRYSDSDEGCSSIWFPSLVVMINGCFIPEAALPSLDRVVTSSSFTLLQDIINHRLLEPAA